MAEPTPIHDDDAALLDAAAHLAEDVLDLLARSPIGLRHAVLDDRLRARALAVRGMVARLAARGMARLAVDDCDGRPLATIDASLETPDGR